MLKRIIIFVVALVLVFSFCSTALAFDYISSTSASLNINASGKATCNASLDAVSGVDSVRIYGYLKQLTGSGWVTIKSWSLTTPGNTTAMYREQYVMAGYSYKYVVYFYAYEGNDTETTSSTRYDGY